MDGIGTFSYEVNPRTTDLTFTCADGRRYRLSGIEAIGNIGEVFENPDVEPTGCFEKLPLVSVMSTYNREVDGFGLAFSLGIAGSDPLQNNTEKVWECFDPDDAE